MKNRDINNKVITYFLFLLYIASSLLLHWNNFDLPLIRDEGEYAYAAKLLVQKHTMPYRDSFMQKPPMVIYAYLPAIVLPGYWPPRVLVFILILVAGLLMKKIADHHFGAPAGWTAAFLLPPMVMMPNIDQFPANTEKWAVLPLVLLWYFYTFSDKPPENKKLFLAGMVAAIIFFLKYSFAPLLLYIFVIWLIEIGFTKGQRNWPSVRNFIIMTLTGFVLASSLILLPFLVTGTHKDLYECTIRFNRVYLSGHLLQFEAIDFWLKRFFSSWPLAVLSIPIFTALPIPRRHLYLGLFLIAYVTTFGSWYGQYYIALTTVWVFLLAAIAGYLNKSIQKKPWSSFVSTALALLFVISAFWPNLRFLRLSTEALDRVKLAWQPFSESRLLAEKIKSMTSKDSKILVAGSEPQIYYYADRRSATRFTIFYPLTLPTVLAVEYQEEAITQLQRNKPTAIAIVQSPYSWLLSEKTPPHIINYIETMIKSGEYSLVGYTTGNQTGVGWHEATEGTIPNSATILLFMKDLQYFGAAPLVMKYF